MKHDHLEFLCGRPLKDRGVIVDLPTESGFMYLEFWKSEGIWKLCTFNRRENTEITLSKDEVSAFARDGIGRRAIVDYATSGLANE
jgi:hypothetical protein